MEPSGSPKLSKSPDTSNCERDNDGDIISAMTYDKIKKGRLITVRSGDQRYCFDIDDLYRYWFDNHLKAPQNPFDRTILPKDVIKKLENYKESVQCLITVKYARRRNSFRMSYHQHIGALISQVLSTTPGFH